MKSWISATIFAATLACANSAAASVFTDDLSKCLVSSTSKDDRLALMRWIFAAMANSPSVGNLVNINSAQHDDFDKGIAIIFDRLITVDCRKEAVLALKSDGASALGSAFALLGQVAGRELMTDPKTTAGVQSMTKYLEKDKINAVVKEAGLTTTF